MATKTKNRNNELLMLAADALDDGRDPLSTHFLSEHNVTLDECHALGQQMSVACRNYARLGGSDLAEAVVRGIKDDDLSDAEREAMIHHLRHSNRMREVTKQLAAMNRV